MESVAQWRLGGMRKWWFPALVAIAMSMHGGRLEAQEEVGPIYNFTGLDDDGINKDGANPLAPLTAGTDGYLYGTTSQGGTNGYGTIFRMNPEGGYTTLASFPAGSGPYFQYSGVTLGPDGDFYGTTYEGGANGNGSVFQVTPGGTYTTIHSFSALTNFLNSDGVNPEAGLLYDANTGLFYGTTQAGGTNGYGTVFSVSTTGSVAALYSFANAVTANSPEGDGNTPMAVLALGPDNALYGTTLGGGGYDSGTVFRITTDGDFSTIYVFTGLDDGGGPNGLTLGSDENFYGTAQNGGVNNDGDIFEITTGGQLNPLYSFADGADGKGPTGNVIFGPGGLLYGSATYDGTGGNAAGEVFSYSVTGETLTPIFTFGDIWADGAYPGPALVAGPLGAGGSTLYGVAANGGADGNGVVFGLSFTQIENYPGTYQGLVNGGAGFLSITLGTSGAFTGKCMLGGFAYTLKGRFNAEGSCAGSVAGISLTMQLAGGQAGNPGSYSIQGCAGTAAFTLYHAEYGKGNADPDAGKIGGLGLAATSNATGVPQTVGKATLSVGKTGSVAFTGKLPDGESFTAAAVVTGGPSGKQCSIYAPLAYKHLAAAGTRGYLSGVFALPGGAPTGGLFWEKPAQTKGAYPAAFTTDVTVSQ